MAYWFCVKHHAVEAELAASTRETYGCGWRQWERWCQGRGIRPLPAPPAAVAAFLAERAEAGVHFSTLDCYCSGIAYRHRQEGLADPPPTSSSDASAEDCAGSSGSPRSARLTR